MLAAHGHEFLTSGESTTKQYLPISAPGVCQDVSLGRKSHQREAEGYPTRWRQSYYCVQRCRGSSLPSIRAEAFQQMSLSKQTINETWQRESKTLPLLYSSVWDIPCDGDIPGIDLDQGQILSLKPCPLPGLDHYSVSVCISLCLGILSLAHIFDYYADRIGCHQYGYPHAIIQCTHLNPRFRCYTHYSGWTSAMKLQGITSSAIVRCVAPTPGDQTLTSSGRELCDIFIAIGIPNFDIGKAVQQNRTKSKKTKRRDHAACIVTRNGSAEMAHIWLFLPQQ